MTPRAQVARTSVRDALDSALVALNASGVDTPRLDAEVLLASVLGVERTALFLDPRRGLEPSEAARFRDLVQRRARDREPVAYLVGARGFRHIELAVDPRVLIPRPETEHLVESALGLPEGARVIDVGTGSGAVALALKHERPDLRLTGSDVSEDALAVARANGERLDLDVDWALGDLLDAVDGPVDAVVSNPPYVRDDAVLPPDVARHEPAIALFAGPDGFNAFRRLIPAATARGASFLALEVGEGQAAEVSALVGEAGYTDVSVVPDLAGIERVVVGRW